MMGIPTYQHVFESININGLFKSYAFVGLPGSSVALIDNVAQVLRYTNIWRVFHRNWRAPQISFLEDVTSLVSAQIIKTLWSISVRHRSDAKVSDRCLIDVDPMVFVIWVGKDLYHNLSYEILCSWWHHQMEEVSASLALLWGESSGHQWIPQTKVQ